MCHTLFTVLCLVPSTKSVVAGSWNRKYSETAIGSLWKISISSAESENRFFFSFCQNLVYILAGERNFSCFCQSEVLECSGDLKQPNMLTKNLDTLLRILRFLQNYFITKFDVACSQ